MTSSLPSMELSPRVALFSAVWAGVAALGVALHAATTLLLGGAADLRAAPFVLQVLSAVIPIVMWALCRVPRSTAFCRAVEALGLVAGTVAIAFMCHLLAHQRISSIPGTSPEVSALLVSNAYEILSLIAVFSSSLIFTARSALVPSRMSHTIVLGLAIGITTILVLVLAYDGRPSEGDYTRIVIVIFTTSTWTLAVAMCAVLSAIIHGLHREIQKARKLGQYTLEEKIGEGGMGVVYRAHHAMLRRPTAIKLLQPDRVGDEAVKRFEREVQLTAELTHPNTITVYDYGRTPDGIFYYAMEFLDGASVQAIVEATGAQPPRRVVHVLRMITGALSEAHGRGLIHRDIKPANIILSERGGTPDVATILDFGLVRDLGNREDVGATFEGKLMGTPMYLAPEVIKDANAADARTDIYALGVVAYCMLIGHPPFEGKTIFEVCSHHLHSPVVPPSIRLNAPLHAGLEALLLRCLAKDPAERPQSAIALSEALATFDVAPWTADDARSWWKTHGPKIRIARDRTPLAGSQTELALTKV
ncbi:serine/threonine protein kinase [Pendulispora rubella]|uniref:Serine/threonine protein kinase n=1 Tax=Pendulispora rubella TaxID=2741070 RepID=A0ABZ2L6X1_9BACT